MAEPERHAARMILEYLRFWWFEGDSIHYDAERYAKVRGITVEEATDELRETLAKLLPDVPIQTSE